ncbi:MAG: hypothetical protein AB1758_13350 [Candidatus Eremiobacterota bacterium]
MEVDDFLSVMAPIYEQARTMLTAGDLKVGASDASDEVMAGKGARPRGRELQALRQARSGRLDTAWASRRWGIGTPEARQRLEVLARKGWLLERHGRTGEPTTS